MKSKLPFLPQQVSDLLLGFVLLPLYARLLVIEDKLARRRDVRVWSRA